MAHPFFAATLGFFETLAGIGAGANPTERHRLRFVERAGNARIAASVLLSSAVAGCGTAGFFLTMADKFLGPVLTPVALASGFTVGLTTWLFDVATVEYLDRLRAQSELRWRKADILPSRARGLKQAMILPLRGTQALITSALAGLCFASLVFDTDATERLAAEAKERNAPVMTAARTQVEARASALKAAYEKAARAATNVTNTVVGPKNTAAAAKTPVVIAGELFDNRRSELDVEKVGLSNLLSTQQARTSEARARLSCEMQLIGCDEAKHPVTGNRGPGPNARQADNDVKASLAEEAKLQGRLMALNQQIMNLENDRAAAMKDAAARTEAAGTVTQQLQHVTDVQRSEERKALRDAESTALENWSTAAKSMAADIEEVTKHSGDLKQPRSGVTARMWALWQLRNEAWNAVAFGALTLLAMFLELAPLVTAVLFSTRRFGPLIEEIEHDRQVQEELRKDRWRNR